MTTSLGPGAAFELKLENRVGWESWVSKEQSRRRVSSWYNLFAVAVAEQKRLGNLERTEVHLGSCYEVQVCGEGLAL